MFLMLMFQIHHTVHTMILSCPPKLHQALLVSNTFTHQLTPITLVEMMVAYWCLRSTGGVGWYNSNTLAGASQAHKHLQLVPLDEFWDMRKDDSEYVSNCVKTIPVHPSYTIHTVGKPYNDHIKTIHANTYSIQTNTHHFPYPYP
ncbi:hypothetical protein EON63_10220 [archaeon]|nr:MAG: hypothetical protein EON63_10220 [archaeon]